MRECIRVCLDCADVCEAAGKLAMRRTGSNDAVLREMLEVCARSATVAPRSASGTTTSIAELCAQMCRECAEDCRNASDGEGN